MAGLCSLLSLACAGPLVESTEGGKDTFVHRDLGYSIAAPGVERSSAWRRFDLEGADLAYRDGRGSAMSLATRCRATQASVAALARHVTIGTERTDLLAAGPTSLAGASGWSQTFDTVEDGTRLRIKAVTVVFGRCVYDWLLVARDAKGFERLEAVFDAWTETFAPPPSHEAASGAGDEVAP